MGFFCVFFQGEKQEVTTSEMLRQSNSFLKVVNIPCRNSKVSFPAYALALLA